MRPSLVDAVSRAAVRVARGMGGYLADGLHRATDFTLDAGGYLPAEPDDPSPAALVFVQRRRASYLGYQVYGGTYTAGDPETLPGGVLVPTRDSAMTADGNLDLDAANEAMAALDIRWLALGLQATKSSCVVMARPWCSWSTYRQGRVLAAFDPSTSFKADFGDLQSGRSAGVI